MQKPAPAGSVTDGSQFSELEGPEEALAADAARGVDAAEAVLAADAALAAEAGLAADAALAAEAALAADAPLAACAALSLVNVGTVYAVSAIAPIRPITLRRLSFVSVLAVMICPLFLLKRAKCRVPSPKVSCLGEQLA